MLISHPDRSLAQHLAACNAISEKILAQHQVKPAFYDKAKLEQWRKLLVYFHDLGKATDFFQAKIISILLDQRDAPKVRACYEQHRPYIETFKTEKLQKTLGELHDEPMLGYHAAIGSYFLQAHLPEGTPLIERLILLEVIKRHHGNLKNFEAGGEIQFEACWSQTEYFEVLRERLNIKSYQENIHPIKAEDWEAILPFFKRRKLAKYWSKFTREATEENLRYFFLQHYLFSLLLSADKGDMQLEAQGVARKEEYLREVHTFAPDLIPNYKQKKFGTSPPQGINKLREEAFQTIAQNAKQHANHSFFSITLPTGLGKTFAAYHTAIQLQHATQKAGQGRARIVYCLPFTSVIDQNASVWEDILKQHEAYKDHAADYFAVNHYLSPVLRENEHSDQISIKQAEYLVEGWEQDFIITTFVKLLDGIFTNKNRLLRKFHNMTNAIILLDEVQSIPPKYYEALELVFRKIATYFGTKFVFITATQPLLFSPQGQADILELTKTAEKETRHFFDALNRIELDQSLLRKHNYLPIPEEEGNILEVFVADIKAQPQSSFLIICNTVKHSQEVFNQLEAHFGNQRPCRYLSASLLPIIRRQKIQEIKADSQKQVPQIVVSTQVVEAGVDIDLDIVYRDFAPLDSINQSAGRCNRNAREGFKGTVKLFHSGKAKYIYDLVALRATEQTLNDRTQFGDRIPEHQLYPLNQTYFQKVHQNISKENDASQELIRCMQTLQLETLNERFRLIESLDFLYYNVFIPYVPEAIKIWEQYRACFQEQDTFKRKRKIKQLRPQLLQYVTRFPKEKYQPPKEQEENHIIYCSDWQNYYDLETGFNHSRLEENTLIL